MSFEIELHVQQGEVYELSWTVPDVPVVNVFVDPEGGEQSFPDPDPSPGGKTVHRIEVRGHYGVRESVLVHEAFKKNRTPPDVEHVVEPIEQMKLKHFSARFEARRAGVKRFVVTGGPDNMEWVRTMRVERVPRQYNTITEVADDPTAIRRHAILAQIADFFPAFNTSSKEKGADHTLAVNAESNLRGQGKWKASYGFDATQQGTSCTTVNPRMMGGIAASDTDRWAFNAGPTYEKNAFGRYVRVPNSENPAWVEADATHTPSVGDTYIVFNGYRMYNGHVGIVVHRPPDGNGLWVTADGGQGTKPQQLALLVPRWGIMGAHLPKGGKVPGGAGHYPSMKKEPDGGPFLSGAAGGHIQHEHPELVPPVTGDPAAIAKWLKFLETSTADAVSNPRRIWGYVDVDDIDALLFDVDKTGYDEDNVKKCRALAKKVQAVIDVGKAGKTLAAGT